MIAPYVAIVRTKATSVARGPYAAADAAEMYNQNIALNSDHQAMVTDHRPTGGE